MNLLRFDPANPPLSDRDYCLPPNAQDFHPDEVVEVPILLHGWQISALENEAHQRGLTTAEMMRHLLRDFISSIRTPANGLHRTSAF